MAWYPGAIRKEITRFRTPLFQPVRVNYHTAVSSTTSLYSYFNVSGRPCSHFYVREDGAVEQYVDTRYQAACDLRGNPSSISIETWDGYLRTWRDGQPVPPWTPAQVESLIRLTAWIIANHPSIPLRLASTSKSDSTSHGLSWHRLGAPASSAQQSAGISQTGGMLYTNAVGKVCPGDARIAQIRTILATLTSTKDDDDMQLAELIAFRPITGGRNIFDGVNHAITLADLAVLEGRAQAAGLTEAIKHLAIGQGADPEAILAAAEAGARRAMADLRLAAQAA